MNWNFWLLNIIVIVAFLAFTIWSLRRLPMIYALYRIIKGDRSRRPLVRLAVLVAAPLAAWLALRFFLHARYGYVMAEDAAYVRLAKRLLTEGTYPAIATHDEAILREVTRFAREQDISADRYEFQMLYGIRRDLQASLTGEGYAVRVYVPFGREWFPYFMRRLGERPANVGFVLRSLILER